MNDFAPSYYQRSTLPSKSLQHHRLIGTLGSKLEATPKHSEGLRTRKKEYFSVLKIHDNKMKMLSCGDPRKS